MTLADDDRLWRDQNTPNVNDEDYKKIIDVCDAKGNGKGKGNGKDKDQKEKKKIPLKKYTANGRLPLHESIILGLDSKFVTLDSQGKYQFKDSIYLNDSQELVPGDTIHTQNPLPYIFDSEEEFKEYLDLARNETFDSLYLTIDSIFRKYVNVEEHYYAELVGKTIWSWFQDKFGYTHYIIIVGDNASGKNSALLVFRYLGYRVFYVVSASAANYYTQLGTIEEGQCTIAEDEAEDLAEDKDKRNVVKTGYCSGGSIPKVELEGGRRQDNWLTYCDKWYAMEELSENKWMKGVLDRSLPLKFVTGDVPYNIKDVIRSAGDPKYEPLFKELIRTRKLLFCFRLLHSNDTIFDVDLNVKNRSAELTKPLIRLFQNSPIALERIIDSLSKFMIERNEVKKNSFESKLYDAISDLKNIDEGNVFVLTNEEIREKLKENLDGKDLHDKVGVFYSPEVGNVSQKRITSTAKSKFKARSVIKRIDDKAERCLQFEQQYLDRIRSNYEAPDKIEIVTLVTDVTLSGDISTQVESFRGAQNNLFYEKNIRNHINAYQIYNNGSQNSDFATDLNVIKEEHIFPKTVTSVTSVTSAAPALNDFDFMYDCYYCLKNKKEKFRTNDQREYENHVIQKHPGKPCYPGVADLAYHGLKAQDKPWEI